MARIAERIDGLAVGARKKRVQAAAPADPDRERRKRELQEGIRNGTDPVLVAIQTARSTPHAFKTARVRSIRLPNFCTTCGLLKGHPVHAKPAWRKA
jgi:hypothetical protein